MRSALPSLLAARRTPLTDSMLLQLFAAKMYALWQLERVQGAFMLCSRTPDLLGSIELVEVVTTGTLDLLCAALAHAASTLASEGDNGEQNSRTVLHDRLFALAIPSICTSLS